MRRIVSVLAVAAMTAFASVMLLGVAAGAGEGDDQAVIEPPDTTIVVAKTVDGSATGPFSAEVSCDNGSLLSTLVFDASGVPDTFSGEGTWADVDGTWQLSFPSPGPLECTATETEADGATSTSWTCTYEATVVSDEVDAAQNGTEAGCAADSGSGVGPVGFDLAGPTEIVFQTATITFTNSFAAPEAVAVAPTFTG